jgi:hypothetical protein
MAETTKSDVSGSTKSEAQKLQFGHEGVLEVEQSFSSKGGFLHKTTDGGYFYRPSEPLKDEAEADKLPEPYKTEAKEFITKWAEEHPEEPEPEPEPKEEAPKEEGWRRR